MTSLCNKAQSLLKHSLVCGLDSINLKKLVVYIVWWCTVTSHLHVHVLKVTTVANSVQKNHIDMYIPLPCLCLCPVLCVALSSARGYGELPLG